MAVGRAQSAHGRSSCAVGILDQLRRGKGVAETGIHADERVYAKQAHEGHEFVCSNIIRLKAATDWVQARRALIGIAYGVAPFERGEVVPPGEAPHAGALGLQQCDRVGAEAVNIVGRHERDGADVKRALARGGDLESPVVGIGAGGEFEWDLGVGRVHGSDGNSLAAAGAFAP